jgi:hypothetical protein
VTIAQGTKELRAAGLDAVLTGPMHYARNKQKQFLYEQSSALKIRN